MSIINGKSWVEIIVHRTTVLFMNFTKLVEYHKYYKRLPRLKWWKLIILWVFGQYRIFYYYFRLSEIKIIHYILKRFWAKFGIIILYNIVKHSFSRKFYFSICGIITKLITRFILAYCIELNILYQISF